MKDSNNNTRRDFLIGIAAGLSSVGLVGMVPANKSKISYQDNPKSSRNNIKLFQNGRDIILSDRQGFNRRWFANNLQKVYVPTSAEQLPHIVSEALATYGKNVKITSGRHCYENFVYNENTKAIVDMSALNQVGFDHEKNAYFIDAGADNWSIYRTLLNSFGKTIPGGTCYSVGAGGLISGGGCGPLSRLHGLAVDHLTGVDIVTADGKLRYISPNNSDVDERNLFWAQCGGGGGNFGVIARYYFTTLPNAPEQATLFNLTWNWADVSKKKFEQILKAYSEMLESMPLEAFASLVLTHATSWQFGLTIQVVSRDGVGSREHKRKAEAIISNIQNEFSKITPARQLMRSPADLPNWARSFPASSGTSIKHLTYLEALQILNGSGPNQFGAFKSAYMKKAFPMNQIEALHEHFNRVPENMQGFDMSGAMLEIDSHGGAINTVAADATPIAQRSSIMKLQYMYYWQNSSEVGEYDRSEDDRQLPWIRGIYKSVYDDYGGTPNPYEDQTNTVGGCYYNYPDVDLGTNEAGTIHNALKLYFLENVDRLVLIKKRWDPDNYFHHAQSIPVQLASQ